MIAGQGPSAASTRRRRVLLSLDGGGVRGIHAILILKEIMRKINLNRKGNDPLEPWQVFDLIGGTSTGGIIAFMLGCLKMSLNECEEAYVTMAKDIFKRKRSKCNPLRAVDFWKGTERFDSESMEKILKRTIAQRAGRDTIGLGDFRTPCKVFVTTVREDNQQLCLLRSYENPQQPDDPSPDWQAWEALRATSAANTYFRAHRKGGYGYLDGAFQANNPVFWVMSEANELWDMPEAVMVSIGTGEKALLSIQGNRLNLVKALTKGVISGAAINDDFHRSNKKMADAGLLFRFNAPYVGQVKIEDHSSIPHIKSRTEGYLRNALIQREVERCSKAMTYRPKEVITDAPVKPESTTISQLTQEEKDCLRMIHQTVGDYHSHRITIDKAVPGTCDWFLRHDRFQAWSDSRTASLLWVTANPGCGKSVLTNLLVDTIQQSSTSPIVCYFFFKAGEQKRGESYYALATLLHQLLLQVPGGVKAVMEAGSGMDSTLITKNVDWLWKALRKGLKEAGPQQVVFLVDALDECSESSRNRFIDLLTSAFASDDFANRMPTNLKLLITSRPWPTIEARFKNLNPIRLRGEDETQISDDIRTMVKYKIEELARDSFLGPETRRLVEERLLRGADHTFLWASLVFAELSNLPSRTFKAIRKALDSIPGDLNQLYESTFSKIRGHTAAQKLLRLIVAARSPLHLDDINVMLNIDKDTESLEHLGLDLEPQMEFTAKKLGGFFIRIIHSRIHLVHQTARDFLLRSVPNPKSDLDTTVLNAKECEIDHSCACVRFLTLKGMPKIRSLPSREENVQLITRQFISELPAWARHFYPYAAKHWCPVSGAALILDEDKDFKERSSSLCNAKGSSFPSWWCFYILRDDTTTKTTRYLRELLGHSTLVRRDFYVTKKLFESGSWTTTEQNVFGQDMLLEATDRHEFQFVDWLLCHCPFTESQKGSAFIEVLASGASRAMERFLKTGIDINATYPYARKETTPGERAALNNRHEQLLVLLDRGLIVTGDQIVVACQWGSKEALEILIRHDKRNDVEKKLTINKALREAASEGFIDCYELICKLAPDLIEDKPDIRIGLAGSVRRLDHVSTQKLLDLGADATEALMISATFVSDDFTRLLLEQREFSKWQLDAALMEYFKLRFDAGLQGYVSKTIRRVMATNDDSARMYNGFPFLMALESIELAVEPFIEHGARLSPETYAEVVCLAIAFEDKPAIFLLRNIDRLQNGSLTMWDFLTVACLWGKTGVMETIMSSSSSKGNAADSLGMTPMLAAVASGNSEAVSLLLGRGMGWKQVVTCDVANKRNGVDAAISQIPSLWIECLGGQLQESPLSLARRLGYGDIEKLLDRAASS